MRSFIWAVFLAALPALGQGTHSAAADTGLMARTIMQAWPQGSVLTTRNPGSWGYEEGVLLDGLAADWRQRHDPAELAYIQTAVDKYVTKDGMIQMNSTGKSFTTDEHQLDNIELGRAILFLYNQTHDRRYATAAKFLHDQLEKQPRNASGGYWHKTIYPNQMWLDGAYMAEPFRALYAVTFHQPAEFDDIARQIELMFDHMRDPATGLLKHGWDESKKMPWVDPRTGLSPEVWSRALGWYCMALVDVLEAMPAAHPQHARLVDILRQTMAAVVKYQDPTTGVWWQVMDAAARPGNFPEASASAMFVYALAKGAREGYLPHSEQDVAERGWAGIQKAFVTHLAGGQVALTGTVKAAGLGGTPYRSGTYDYYVAEKTGDDDAKGVGAYLLAGSEMEQIRPAKR